MSSQLEIACFNMQSALIASASGADRIELAADYSSGGVTPDITEFDMIRHQISIPIYILIRSRAGDFVYDESEMEEMISSILAFRKLGADGFVFGCLDRENSVDETGLALLMEAAGGLSCTFHRAFDRLANLSAGLEKIMAAGCHTILTSGGAANALTGASTLSSLSEQAEGRICIMAGGGIRSGNISELRNTFASTWYHSACITGSEPVADAEEIQKLKEFLQK